MTDRRAVYFAFQGLFMAVVLLIFAYQYRDLSDWPVRFSFLCALTIGTLASLQKASDETLGSWWFQAGLFIGDTLVTTLVLHWREARSQAYLIYFLIIFGTALTRNSKQSLVLGTITSCLYLLIGWTPAHGFPHDAAFWLRFELLIITTCLLAILSHDSQRTQSAQERRYQQRIVQVERLATLGQLASEVAHRIKGPLTTIMVNAEVLEHRLAKNKDALKELREIQYEVGRCKQILKHLLDLGRIEEMDLEKVDLCVPLRHALKAIDAQARAKSVRVEASLDGTRAVRGDQSLLQEAFFAILENAIQAVKQGGWVKVSVSQSPRHWLVIVEDDGSGISEEALERLFEPFYTTKGAEGNGLGLSAALRIMQKHSGSIEATSLGPGKGARFTFAVPRA